MAGQAGDFRLQDSLLALIDWENGDVRPCKDVLFESLRSLLKPAKFDLFKDPVRQDVRLRCVVLISRAFLNRERYIVVKERQIFASQPVFEALRV